VHVYVNWAFYNLQLYTYSIIGTGVHAGLPRPRIPSGYALAWDWCVWSSFLYVSSSIDLYILVQVFMPPWRKLRWLSVAEHLESKRCVTVYRRLHGVGLIYLSFDFTRVSDLASRQRLRFGSYCNTAIVRFLLFLHGSGMHCHRRDVTDAPTLSSFPWRVKT